MLNSKKTSVLYEGEQERVRGIKGGLTKKAVYLW
jgi:hypothetical protein